LEDALQRGEATQLAVRIDTVGVFKPLPGTDVIGGRRWGAGQLHDALHHEPFL